MNIYDHAHALAKAIKVSPEFKAFRIAKEKLDGESSAKEMLTNFRQQQFELQKQKLSGLETSPEQEEKLKKLMEVIYLNQTVKGYMEAEYRFSVMLADIQKIIGESMEELMEMDPGTEQGTEQEEK